MQKLRFALGLFRYTALRNWPGLAFYFFGVLCYRLLGIKLFQERLLKLKPFTVCADIHEQNGLSFLHEILVQGIYNQSFTSGGSVQMFYDVGANCGFFTLTQCTRESGLRAVCFEPQPVTFSRLQHNLAANGLTNRVTAENLAVAASSGTCDLNMSATSSMGIMTVSTTQYLEKPKVIQVGMTSLDDYAARSGNYPDFLKIDIEGFEVEALKGARTCLAKARMVVLEIHSDELARQSLELLHAAGFKTRQEGPIIFANK